MALQQDKPKEQSIKSILVPFDNSNQSKHAFDTALDLAKKNNAKLLVIMWINTSGDRIDRGLSRGSFDEMNHAMSMKHLEDKVKQENVIASFEVMPFFGLNNSKLGKNIASFANTYGLDMIVIGRKEGGKFNKTIFGSVLDTVEQHASCQVIKIT
jgi:nucleotide-binding universal stress UspA family protein